MSENTTETEVRPLVCRAANQAARAVVKVIEAHTGKEVSLYDSMRLVNVLGCALERNGLEGGPSGEIRAILEQPYVPKPDSEANDLAALRAENAALLVDKARLDWLDERITSDQMEELTDQPSHICASQNLRACIDRARLAQVADSMREAPTE